MTIKALKQLLFANRFPWNVCFTNNTILYCYFLKYYCAKLSKGILMEKISDDYLLYAPFESFKTTICFQVPCEGTRTSQV